MSKIQVVLSLLIIAALSFSFITIKKQKDELAVQDKRISDLWFEKLTDYQYLINTTFRDYPQNPIKSMFDSLDGSLDIMLKLSYHEDLTIQDKEYLNDFIFSTLVDRSYREGVILENLEIDSRDELFLGSNFEIVERLERVVNPYIMTKCKEGQSFDLYEKHEEWNFQKGDTVKLMVRLLPNYSLQSHVVELVPSSSLFLLNPYFGEIHYIAEEDAMQGSRHEIKYETYDLISRDTVENSVLLTGGVHPW
jgi:hypothetical protein